MNQKVTMKEIPSADRPYEKCEKLGALVTCVLDNISLYLLNNLLYGAGFRIEKNFDGGFLILKHNRG